MNRKQSAIYISCIALIIPIVFIPFKTRAQSSNQVSQARPYFSQPAISPDLKEIAFVSGGDIWTVPTDGGVARLLVSNPATESRPLYSPDGGKLAFVSTRTGGGDIYVLNLRTGGLNRVTYDDGPEQLDAWSYDGRWLYFSTASHDISYMNDVYRVSAEGGTPMPVTAERYTNEYFSAPSPDGKSVAFTARGIDSIQWWRKGHSHLDESEIWLMRAGAPASYERVDGGDWKDIWPMWASDARGLYYVSDQSGAQNIWFKPENGKPRQVTRFTGGRVLWPSISYNGRTIVFEHDFEIWKLETATGRASRVPIELRGAASGPAITHLTLSAGFQELALSPDGKKLAVVVHGQVFAASSKDGGDAIRVSRTEADEAEVEWAPDSKRLIFSSDRDGIRHLFLYDFASSADTRLTNATEEDYAPLFSIDGKSVAFIRGGRQIILLDLDSKQEKVLATAAFRRPPFDQQKPLAFSPDGKWLAFESVSGRMFTNVSVVPVAGGESRQISFIPNGFSNSLSWSPDGKYILFDTGQRTEVRNVARIDLVPRTPRFREDEFLDLFKQSPKIIPPVEKTQTTVEEKEKVTGEKGAGENKSEPKKAVEIVFDGIRDRISLLPTGIDIGYQTISPDGKTLLMIASAAGHQNLYVYSLDELAKEPPVARQITSTPGFKIHPQFSPDGKSVFYLEQGRIHEVSLDGRESKQIPVTAEMDVDFSKQKVEAFHEAWTYLNDNFFDSNFNGVNWKGVEAEYAPLIAGSRTPDEMRDLLELMVGELDASHLGVSAPPLGEQPETGKLGLSFDPAQYENSGRLRITEIVPLGPAALAGNIKTGDYLLALDGAAVDSHTNLDQLLEHKIGKKVALIVAASADGNGKREVEVQPINQATEKHLLYDDWVQRNRAYVAKASGGRLGYVHMQDMGMGSLEALFMNLDEENMGREGVIVDVRNNTGGFVNAYAIDVLARRPYLTMSVRGLPSAPARSVLGQRALELPTALLTNRHSLSDAEDFTEGYRTLKLGKVIGEPTSGWIIYTGGVQLIDGSIFRIPFMKVSAHDGTPMEMHPRPVDVEVTRPIGESLTGKDSQLDAAVRELLEEVHAEGSAPSGKRSERSGEK